MSANANYLPELANTIDALTSDDFSPALLELIRTAADFDSAVIMAYPRTSALQVIYNALHEGDQTGFGTTYQDRLWLFSPLYLSAKSGERGFFHILDIAPDNFQNSEYYQLYYHSNGVRDQTGFLVESGDGCPVAISLERTASMEIFTTADKKHLQELADTVAALVRQQWPNGLSPATEAVEPSLHLHVENLLKQFGSSCLTPRERDVVQLVLKGYPSKAAAHLLGISAQTEQVHRKNIYNKLGLSSHGELFSLFFDALVQPALESGDPLSSLLVARATT
jgi:DNA-binding CsgD family transcriptional regulator